MALLSRQQRLTRSWAYKTMQHPSSSIGECFDVSSYIVAAVVGEAEDICSQSHTGRECAIFTQAVPFGMESLHCARNVRGYGRVRRKAME